MFDQLFNRHEALEMKAKAVAHCEIKEPKRTRHWREDPGLISFLRSL